MEARLGSKRLAALGGLLALAGGVAALTPGAMAAAGPVHKCANKTEVIEIQGGPGEAPRKYKVTIKAISTQGVSCAAAYKFLALQYKSNTTSTIPEHYKCTTGHFKVPVGTVPQVCTKPGAKIQYAGQGG